MYSMTMYAVLLASKKSRTLTITCCLSIRAMVRASSRNFCLPRSKLWAGRPRKLVTFSDAAALRVARSTG